MRSNIVEGYGRRNYKNDYVRFLVFAIASNDETRDHMETLFETKSLTDESIFNDISSKIDNLGKKLYYYLKSVEKNHMSEK